MERFWKKVDKTETCWLWVGAKSSCGYGYITINKKDNRAHRVSWELHNGPIPKGKGYHGTCVLHKCDNRLCVNPDHLFLGTNKNNMDDKVNKKRQAKGLTHGMVKLTEKEVFEIRDKYIPKIYTQRQLAKEYKVDQRLIWGIVNRKNWKHI